MIKENIIPTLQYEYLMVHNLVGKVVKLDKSIELPDGCNVNAVRYIDREFEYFVSGTHCGWCKQDCYYGLDEDTIIKIFCEILDVHITTTVIYGIAKNRK